MVSTVPVSPNPVWRRSEDAILFLQRALEPKIIWRPSSCSKHMHVHACSHLGPFSTPHVRGSFVPRARERDRLINRLLRSNYAYVPTSPFSSPFIPRPMGGRYVRFAYSMASMHYTRNLSCTRRILVATRNYKLIRNQQVSPSMTDETASSPLVLAVSCRIQVHCAKKNMQIGNITIVRT